MKTSKILLVTALIVTGYLSSHGQVMQAEVPGDNFSLEGALELFKKSESPEQFERLLNSPDSKVNNLDLNGDGYIDYIRVFDRYEGNVHVFIIQAVISSSESQDIAVIQLEKLADGRAVLQIIGDADVYGVETIIEPTREVRTYAGTQTTQTVVNVWAWPSVQYIYGPDYSVWDSPWHWNYRPVWWRPWRPVAYVHYYPLWRPYRPYYSVCHTYRVAHAHNIYRPYRSTSVIVYHRHREQISRYRTEHRDDFRNERSRTDDRYGRRDDRSRQRPPEDQASSPSPGRTRYDRGSDVDFSDRKQDTHRPASRSRSMNQEIDRNPTQRERIDYSNRRPSLVQDRDIRRDVGPSPGERGRSRTYESSPAPQRTAPTQRHMNSEVRQPSEIRRESAPSRSHTTPAPARSEPQPPPAVNRSRSESPTHQSPADRTREIKSSDNSRRGRD